MNRAEIKRIGAYLKDLEEGLYEWDYRALQKIVANLKFLCPTQRTCKCLQQKKIGAKNAQKKSFFQKNNIFF